MADAKSEVVKLFPYQLEGAKWLAHHKLGLLADDMGVGKTAQAIRACDDVGAKRILVICPAIVRSNWVAEFRKFSSQNRLFTILKTKSQAFDDDSSIVTSFDLVEHVPKHLTFDVVIIDEAHFLKSPEAKRSRVVLGKDGVVRRAARVWFLSGTPAPNHAGELWPILYTIGATPLGYDDFIKRYCNWFEDGRRGIRITGTKRETTPELRAILERVMLRRKKEDVIKELPGLFVTSQSVEPREFDPGEWHTFVHHTVSDFAREALYQRLELEADLVEKLVDVGENFRLTAQALESIGSSVSTLRRFIGMQKVAAIAEIVKNEMDMGLYDKLVIFAHHIDVIKYLRQELKDYHPATLHGATPQEKRDEIIFRFQNEQFPSIIIANIATAGTGITLTRANHVFFAECDWVPGNNLQAIMRCHRIGQTKTVFCRYFTAFGTVDDRVTDIIKRKTNELLYLFDGRFNGFEKEENAIIQQYGGDAVIPLVTPTNKPTTKG